MFRTVTLGSLAGLALAMAACADAPAPDTHDVAGPELAPATTSFPGEITLVSGDLVGDGKGSYREGVCGVLMRFNDPAAGSFLFNPAGNSIPKSQTAACAGIAPRSATLRLHTRHLSDDPHIDDSNSPAGSGVFSLGTLQTAGGGATKINTPPACFMVAQNGRTSGRGLRFDRDSFAGSDDLIRVDLGGGRWHIYSPPGALAWCEDNSGISLWHVNLEVLAQVL